MLMLLANSLGASEAADDRPPGEPTLPSRRLIDGGREFGSSIAVSMLGWTNENGIWAIPAERNSV
jgi:hypothetical protein